jgi:DNA-binding transcriptional ArsR family regulator
VSVYVRLTRECYGAGVTITLRELAARTGISKSAVGRALRVLEAIGMVLAKRGTARRAPQYDLADLKDLAVDYGAVFDPKRCSYVLPPGVRLRLQAQVAAAEKRMHGGVSGGQTEERAARESDVPGGDTGDDLAEGAGVPHASGGVPLEAQWCPPNAEKLHGYLICKKARIQNKTPLPPLHARGGCVERVMRECGWVNRRLRPMIAEAIVLAAQRGDAEEEAAARMCASWRELQQASANGLLRYGIAPRKFIAEGHWRTDAMWPYDLERLRSMQQAGVGRLR